jgi:hypothetical protein
MKSVPRRDEPKAFNVIELNEVVETLNNDQLSGADYREVVERRSKGRNIGALMQIRSSEQWFEGGKLPALAVRAARLRELVDEWLDTGTSSDGSHFPERRTLNGTVEAILAVRKCIREFNPCKLHLIEETGEVVVVVGWSGWEHSVASPDHFRHATTEADRIFTAAMTVNWRYLLSKCVYCGRYFTLPNARRQSYPHGTFCSREHQRDHSAATSTKLRREKTSLALVQYAATWLLKHSAGVPWQENETAKRVLAAWLSKKMTTDPNLRTGRECIGVKWVTRNRSAIDTELRRRKHAKG